MNWDQIAEHWTEFAGSARAHWNKLTDDDWLTMNGKKDDLVERIQRRYRLETAEAEKQVDEWSHALQRINEVSIAH